MASEFIRRDFAKKHFEILANRYNGSFTGEAFERASQEIAAMPGSDAVEVVRCKDCWKSAEGLCSYQLKNVPGKDFCGAGERNNNESDS